jgi:hypothetical protein
MLNFMVIVRYDLVSLGYNSYKLPRDIPMFLQNKPPISAFFILLVASVLSACAGAPKPPPIVMIHGLAFSPESCGQYSIVPINRKDHALMNAYIKTYAPKGLGPVLTTQLQAAFVPVEGSLLEKGMFHQGSITFMDMNANQRQFLKDYLLQCPSSNSPQFQEQSILNTLHWLGQQSESYREFKQRVLHKRFAEKAKERALKKAKEKAEQERRAAWKVIKSGTCALRPTYPKTGVIFSISQEFGLHVMSLKGEFETSLLKIDNNKPYKSLYSDSLTKRIQSLTGLDYAVSGYEQVDSKTIIPEMMKGHKLHLSFISNGQLQSSVVFSLSGFAHAYQDYQTCVKPK